MVEIRKTHGAGSGSKEGVLEGISVQLLYGLRDEIYMQGDQSGLPYLIRQFTNRGPAATLADAGNGEDRVPGLESAKVQG